MTITILLLSLPARHLSGPVARKKDADKHLLQAAATVAQVLGPRRNQLKRRATF